MTPAKPPVKKPAPDLEDPAAVLTLGDMQIIGHVLGKTLRTKEDLVKAITTLTVMSVEGVSIMLEPGLLQRLKSRCLQRNGFPEWLAGVVIKQLHSYVGW